MSFSLVFKSDNNDLKLKISEETFQSASDDAVNNFIGQDNFTIKEQDRGFSFLFIKGQFLLDEKELSPNIEHFLPSGRELKNQAYTLVASSISPRAEVSAKEDIKSFIARGTIALIIICEILFITVLPSKLDGKESFKREYLLEEVTEKLDRLRSEASRQIEGSASTSSIKTGILNDIKLSLDDIAKNIRLYPDLYSSKDLQHTEDSLDQCSSLLKKLKFSKLIDQKQGLDKQAILNQTFRDQ